MRATIGFVIASALAIQALDPALTPQTFTSFLGGTAAQDIALTPKGGWTYIG